MAKKEYVEENEIMRTILVFSLLTFLASAMVSIMINQYYYNTVFDCDKITEAKFIEVGCCAWDECQDWKEGMVCEEGVLGGGFEGSKVWYCGSNDWSNIKKCYYEEEINVCGIKTK